MTDRGRVKGVRIVDVFSSNVSFFFFLLLIFNGGGRNPGIVFFQTCQILFVLSSGVPGVTPGSCWRTWEQNLPRKCV